MGAAVLLLAGAAGVAGPAPLLDAVTSSPEPFVLPLPPAPPGQLEDLPIVVAMAAPDATRARFGPGDAAVLRDSWRRVEWFHPLCGRRDLPIRTSRSFGAKRPGDRPSECGAGHCGVDIGDRGLYVHAVRPGVVERIARKIHPTAGRYVRIAHDEGFISYYLHLDSIDPDLQQGDRVEGGQAIAIAGRTGIVHAEPHLHFALAVRDPERPRKKWFIDPMPLLRSALVLDEPLVPLSEEPQDNRWHRNRCVKPVPLARAAPPAGRS
jgi:murein DD-endopeptidase MepM/ murein hydrolase activator NlpD